jgi:cytochrome c-type biogenesis protein CcmH
MFWVIASAALFIAALITFLPLLRGKTFWQPAAVALLFILPAGGIWMYTKIGTPQAIGLQSAPTQAPAPHPGMTNAEGESDIDTMINGLRAKLTESPESLDGWVLLARTLKTMQRFPEALDALQTAQKIAPDDPDVLVELAEAQIFVSSDGQIDEESIGMIERALAMNPTQQKGLWLLGIAAAQAGDLEGAVTHWETLLAQLEPGSTVAQSVQSQIDEANTRLGKPGAAAPVAATIPAAAVARETAPAEPSSGDSWQGTPVRVSASDAARASIPTGATLYVIIRSTGPAVGPPLGVRRMNDPVLPIDITISDRDSMLQERKISLEAEVQLQARISLTGSPAAASGDWQSVPVAVPLTSSDTVELVLDQQVK